MFQHYFVNRKLAVSQQKCKKNCILQVGKLNLAFFAKSSDFFPEINERTIVNSVGTADQLTALFLGAQSIMQFPGAVTFIFFRNQYGVQMRKVAFYI